MDEQTDGGGVVSTNDTSATSAQNGAGDAAVDTSAVTPLGTTTSVNEDVSEITPTLSEGVTVAESSTAETASVEVVSETVDVSLLPPAASTPEIKETPEHAVLESVVVETKADNADASRVLPASVIDESNKLESGTTEIVEEEKLPPPQEVVHTDTPTEAGVSAPQAETRTVESVKHVGEPADVITNNPAASEAVKSEVSVSANAETKPTLNTEKKVAAPEAVPEVVKEKSAATNDQELSPVKVAAQLSLSEILARLSPKEVKEIFKKYLLEIGKKGRATQHKEKEERKLVVLEHMRVHGKVTRKEVSQVTSLSKTAALRLLQQLEDQGRIVQHGGYRAHDAYYTIK